MFCPQCGEETDAFFCPHCGYKMYSDELAAECESTTYSYEPQVVKRSKKSLCAMVIVICTLLIITISFVAMNDGGEVGVYSSQPSPPEIINPADNDVRISLYGAFENGIMSAEFNDEGEMVITLSDEASSGYTHFDWKFRDVHHIHTIISDGWPYIYNGTELSKEEPVLYWLTPGVGEYEVYVKCYNSTDSNVIEYTGTILYDGEITKTYSWTYQKYTYSTSITYMYTEFLKYAHCSEDVHEIKMGRTSYTQIAQLCEINNVIEDLADKLKKSYLSTYGADASVSGQEFAEFILAFVHLCFEYPPNYSNPDGYIYGMDEYWAQPMELIQYGIGDCEDTAILCASLFKACGYDSAVVLIPRHAVAAVALDDYEPKEIDPRYRVSVFYQVIDGKTYYACETTLRDNYYGIGYLDSGYRYSGGIYYLDGVPYRGDYGFYVLSD